jgi:hypothetical protein
VPPLTVRLRFEFAFVPVTINSEPAARCTASLGLDR